jgi:N-acetylneuraminic acid mutarotase
MKMQNSTHMTPLSQLARAACSLVLIVVAVGLLPLSFAQNSKQAASSEQPQACTVAAGPNMPTTLVRAVGVYFPANNKFYAMGGRTADGTGNDNLTPYEYDVAANTWTMRHETLPDTHMNNMACGVLTDAGTPWIYCVGGSFGGGTDATARVFRFNPVTGVVQNNLGTGWPQAMDGITLPGGFAVYNNKFYVFGGFQINTAMSNTTWEFTPGTNAWVQKANMLTGLGYIPTATIGNFLYTAGGSTWDGTTINDSNLSYRFDPTGNAWTTIAVPPRVVAETRSLNVSNQAYVMGGGRTAPNPNNEVDIYDPPTNAWSLGMPFVTARRNFPTDTNGGSKIWLAGGYASDGVTPLATMEIFTCPVAFQATGAVSRITHAGGCGTFDVNMPLTNPSGVEDRSQAGNNYTLVVTFSATVTAAGTASVTCHNPSTGTGTAGAASASGSTVSIPLNGVSDGQVLTVHLAGVNGTTNVDIPFGRLLGDTNSSRTVSAGDVAQTKAQSGNAVTAANFREDVNANCAINAGDVAIVKGRLGITTAPASCP